MPPRRGPAHLGKRTEPEIAVDAGSARVEPQRGVPPPAVRQRIEEQEEVRDRDQEMAELRAEIRALKEQMARGKFPTQSSASTPPPVLVPRREARRVLDDEGVTVQDFLKFKTPEFKGEEGEDPQEFLEEIEKMIRRLPCSDARAIELVGTRMKRNTWEWYQRHIENQLYSGNPPTWEEFGQMVMDEFLAPAERQNRALQFERLKQVSGMSVTEYAREFIRLRKYAPHIIPTEAARVQRFRSGLIAPLYNAVLAAEFSTLSKLIDKAKQWESRNREERTEREQKEKSMIKGQSSSSKVMGVSLPRDRAKQHAHSAPPTLYRRKKGRGQSHDTLVHLPPRPFVDTASTERISRLWLICRICKRRHVGQCRASRGRCFKCGQPGHYIKDCPQNIAQQSAPLVSYPTVQVGRPGDKRSTDRGGSQMPQ